MSTHLTLMPETPLARLKRQWHDLNTKAVDVDVSRGAVLQEAVDAGLTQREVAQEVGIDQGYITRLLRYHRFVLFVQAELMPMGIKTIPERQFREYWEQKSDPRTNRQYFRNPTKKEEYERKVFRDIAELIQAGETPQKLVKPAKPKTARQIRQALDASAAEPLAALRKEIRQHYYGELKKTLDTMEKLLGADRSRYAPTVLGTYARVLKQHMGQILKLLDDVAADDEPADDQPAS